MAEVLMCEANVSEGRRTEVLEALGGAKEGMILDGTLGGGGHAEAMLLRWPECRIPLRR